MDKLTASQKGKIYEAIKELDPKGELVTVTPNSDFKGGSIAYNKDSGITLYENISRLTDEEYCRAYLVVRLVRNSFIFGAPTSFRSADIPIELRRKWGTVLSDSRSN